MDLSRNENTLSNFNHHQLSNLPYISLAIFHNFGLVICAKARASKVKAKVISTRPTKGLTSMIKTIKSY